MAKREDDVREVVTVDDDEADDDSNERLAAEPHTSVGSRTGSNTANSNDRIR